MDPVWVGVVGTLGGVIITGVLSFWSEHARGERDDRRRERERATGVDDRRRELSARLPAIVREVHSRAWSFVDYRESNADWRTDSYVQAQQDRLEESVAECYRTYAELRLIGTDQMGAVAYPLTIAVEQLINAAFAEEPGSGDAGSVLDAIDRYLTQMAGQFGLTGRQTPRAANEDRA